MTDLRVKKHAQLLVHYCLQVRPGQQILIRGSSLGLPLITAVYREVLAAGAHPNLLWGEEALAEIMLKEGNDEQLQYISPTMKLAYESCDGLISVRAPANTRVLSRVKPERYSMQVSATGELSALIMRRAAEEGLPWVGTIHPTEANAQEADMSLSDYADFVYGACFVDDDDPQEQWRVLSARQQKLIDWLAEKEEVIVQGPDADLKLSIAGRSWVNSNGRRNMPSGEIFTGPVEESVQGWVRFSFPAIYAGREVEGIELRFEDGRVVSASAKKNEAFLRDMLDTDPGARFLGEFAIGTNDGIKHFTKSILFDEKIGGTMHMAVGNGYPETGSKNQSAIHWDMICDLREGGKIWVDGELFYDSGRFLVL
jgi:aminopeptidase